jgi:hypothetical protein
VYEELIDLAGLCHNVLGFGVITSPCICYHELDSFIICESGRDERSDSLFVKERKNGSYLPLLCHNVLSFLSHNVLLPQ